MEIKKPKWTVLYNVVSKENNRWIGTGWEFFDKDSDADKCYARHRDNGNVPTKRPFYDKCDRVHMGVAHRYRETVDSYNFVSVSFVDTSFIKSQWQAHFIQAFPICMDKLPRFHKSDKAFFEEKWEGGPEYTYETFMEKYYPNF